MNEKKQKKERLLKSMWKGIILYKGLKDVHNALKTANATEPIESAENQLASSPKTLDLPGEHLHAEQSSENSVEPTGQTEIPTVLPESPPDTPVTHVIKPDPQKKNETAIQKIKKPMALFSKRVLGLLIAGLISALCSYYVPKWLERNKPVLEPQPSQNSGLPQISQKRYVNAVQEASKSEVIYYECNVSFIF